MAAMRAAAHAAAATTTTAAAGPIGRRVAVVIVGPLGRRQRCGNSSSSSSSSALSPPLPPVAPPLRGRRAGAGASLVIAAAAASAAAAAALDDDDFASDSFYAILGVRPTASRREIKTAYYELMKDVHPDLSDDEESHELSVLINEIYDTLMDPERRAVYDAVSGFEGGGVNPFMDASLPRDQVFVDEATCIGCRNCTHVCPASFAMEEDFGRARVMVQGADSEEKLQEAIDTCPVSCIHWVTAPQLSLLEAAMAKMERVAVWVMMGAGNGASAARDVFTEAATAWEKRQQRARERARQERDRASWAAWWSTAGGDGGSSGSSFYEAARRQASASYGGSGSSSASDSASASYDGADEQDGPPPPPRDGREGARIAKLAARAARAARTLRSWQELQARARQQALGLLLTASSSVDVD